MIKHAEYFIKLLFHVLIGNALVLLAAVREFGKTEFSAALITDAGDVPEMIEALLMGALITVAFGVIITAEEIRNKDT